MTSVSNLQKAYSEYAFLAEGQNASGAVVEASLIGSNIIARSYDAKWYMVVFKPFNKAYEKDNAWFQFKGIDRCRKWLKKPLAYVFTREIEAEKTHINAIVCTNDDLMLKHEGVVANKYKLHIQQLKTLGDRQNALLYIQKERRQLIEYIDYIKSK